MLFVLTRHRKLRKIFGKPVWCLEKRRMPDALIWQVLPMRHATGGGLPCRWRDNVVLRAMDHQTRAGHFAKDWPQIDVGPEQSPAHMGKAKHVCTHQFRIGRTI
jgi:hypothetical protein